MYDKGDQMPGMDVQWSDKHHHDLSAGAVTTIASEIDKLAHHQRAQDEVAKFRRKLFTHLVEATGDDVERPGLAETPARVDKAFRHWFSGYDVDIASLFKAFEDGAEGSDQMVMVKNIPIYSKCEHHISDIFGTATIAYIPNGKIVGLSKLSRVADAFARRLQVQERLTNQIADALVEHLEPIGVGVVIKARHMCMESRGICQQGHHTITSALRGVMRNEEQARSEFFSLANCA
jgi:GTP cyclohydrolase I